MLLQSRLCCFSDLLNIQVLLQPIFLFFSKRLCILKFWKHESTTLNSRILVHLRFQKGSRKLRRNQFEKLQKPFWSQSWTTAVLGITDQEEEVTKRIFEACRSTSTFRSLIDFVEHFRTHLIAIGKRFQLSLTSEEFSLKSSVPRHFVEQINMFINLLSRLLAQTCLDGPSFKRKIGLSSDLGHLLSF